MVGRVEPPSNTLQIEKAFEAGYDPALELATHQNKPANDPGIQGVEIDIDIPWTEHLRRKEQDWIDHIVQGQETGHYFVLLGPKVRAICFEAIAPQFTRFARVQERAL